VAWVIRTAFVWLVVLAIVSAGFLWARDYIRRHPQDVPWTPLRLADPIGIFTRSKLVSLTDAAAKCEGLLRVAGAGDMPVPPRQAGASCGYADGMRLSPAPREARFMPSGVVASCPVAAALLVLERQVVQPAAIRHLAKRVAVIDHAGSYSCRRLYSRAEGGYSEHATADAIDIIGFRLTDGTVISVLRDWRSEGPKAEFLHDVRDGACRLFATSLSPDYNPAHADHLDLDQAERGKMGWGVCR
jgi:hypothetical protein